MRQGSARGAAEAPAGHALVVPYPAQGHLNPVMQLAKQLASRGFLVTFLLPSHFHARLDPSHNSCLHRNIRLIHIPDGLPPHFDRFSGNLESLSRAFEAMAPLIERLVQKLLQECPPVSCIFSDMFAPFMQDVANKFGLPRIAVWLQSAASFTVNLHVPLLISKGHMPVTEKSSDLITCIPAHPPLAPWELPSFYQVQDLSDYMVQFKLKPFLHLKEAHSVLINTFTHLETQILDALNKELCQEDNPHPPLLAAGPFLPPAYINHAWEDPIPELHLSSTQADSRTGMSLWAEDNECLKWLDRQAPNSVLYISFGSIVAMKAPQFLELAYGLDMACSNNKVLRLLWVIRSDFLKNAEVREMAVLPATLRQKEKEGVMYMTAWAPQAMVLAHAAVGAFLTHCGWNSTLEGVSVGVPMLGWPLFSEQWLNRKWIVEEWQIGLRFEEDEQGLVKREEVQRVISAVMQSSAGQAMRERAVRLKHASTQAWTPDGSSSRNLNTVIQGLSSYSFVAN